jgi:hypothetical protein
MNEILTMLASFGGLFLAGANVAVFCIVKFNDLKHQEDSLKRIEKGLDDVDKKLDKFGERIATIEGKCLANHGK